LKPAHVTGIQASARAAIAAGLAGYAASLLGLPFPIYAMITAVIVTDLSSAQTRKLVLPRLIGTLIGALTGAALSVPLQSGSVAVTAGVFAAMMISHLLRLPDAAKLAGYVSGIVLLEYDADPWTYAAYRVVETVLGLIVAVLVSVVPKLLRTEAPAAGPAAGQTVTERPSGASAPAILGPPASDSASARNASAPAGGGANADEAVAPDETMPVARS
jgi:hypothetical protein